MQALTAPQKPRDGRCWATVGPREEGQVRMWLNVETGDLLVEPDPGGRSAALGQCVERAAREVPAVARQVHFPEADRRALLVHRKAPQEAVHGTEAVNEGTLVRMRLNVEVGDSLAG